MLRQAALVLLMAAVLSPAGTAARYGHTATQSTPRPAERVVVRTQLVPASTDGFDWLDAAAGFGLAIVSGGVVLLVIAGRRPHLRSAKN
jgi:hypothetical protein